MVTLYGPDNRPIDMSLLKREVAAPTITGVRTPISGHPAQGLTPQRLTSILREAEAGDPMRYLELAEEMEEKDLHYLAVIGTRKRAVAQLDITVHAAGDTPEDEKNAQLVRDFVAREELETELIDILDAVGKGFSATEIIWDMSERQWMPERLEWRDPRWFTFERVDGTTLMLRGDDGQPEPLAPYKFVVHHHKAKSGLPIRGGLARAAGWGYLFKNYDIKDWIAFAEVYGQPIRVGKYHPSATPEEKAVLLRAVRNIGSDAAAIIPEGMMLEFVKADATRETGQLYKDLADWIDQQVSKAVLGQTTTTDAISGGHAVSKEHNEVRGDIERADAKQLTATLNRAIARPIVDLNRGPQKAYPRIEVSRPEQADVKLITEAAADLIPLGLKVGQRQMREIIGLEDPGDDDELITAGDPGEPATARAAREARAAAELDVQDSVDDLITELIEGDGWEPLVDETLAPIREAIESADTLDAARDALIGLIEDLPAEKLTELLARSNFAARLAGETGADTQD